MYSIRFVWSQTGHVCFLSTQSLPIFPTSTTLLTLFLLLETFSRTHGSIPSLRLKSRAFYFKKAFLVPHVRRVLSGLRISGGWNWCISCATHWEGSHQMGHQSRAGWKGKAWAAEVSKKGDPDPWKREVTGVPGCKYCCEFGEKTSHAQPLVKPNAFECLRHTNRMWFQYRLKSYHKNNIERVSYFLHSITLTGIKPVFTQTLFRGKPNSS